MHITMITEDTYTNIINFLIEMFHGKIGRYTILYINYNIACIYKFLYIKNFF